jgi:hypothetical protein
MANALRELIFFYLFAIVDRPFGKLFRVAEVKNPGPEDQALIKPQRGDVYCQMPMVYGIDNFI